MAGVGDWVGENQGVAKPDDGVNPGPTHSATTPAVGTGSLVFPAITINDNNIKNKKIINIVLKDKKNLGENINLVLIKTIGKAFYLRNQNPNFIFKLID